MWFEVWQVSEETEEQQQKDESKPAKGLFGSGVFNQDSSLGFSGIKWVSEIFNCLVSLLFICFVMLALNKHVRL